MDRKMIYPGQIPLETDLLGTNKNVLIALAKLSSVILGTATQLNGLACTPNSPAALNVIVGAGEIYSLQNVDGTAYSSIAADTTHSILKQGILLDAVTLACPAPGTGGQSIAYLVQVAYQDTDTDAVVLPYYNASNPSQAYSGPNNAGTTNNTVRKGVCTVSVKAGIAATTGTQVAPAPDAGNVGAYVVTVANGQTTITAPNIAVASGAPFITETLGQKISKAYADTLYAPISTTQAAVQGAIKNLVSSCTGLSALVLESVEEIALENSSNLYVTLRNVFLSGNMTASGANGIDTGSVIANAWYSKWVIYNPTTPASAIIFVLAPVLTGNTTSGSAVVTALASTASMRAGMPLWGANFPAGTVVKTVDSASQITASQLALATTTGTSITFVYDPVMPSGYTFKARTGFVRTDNTANKYPLSFVQTGRKVQYKLNAGSNVVTLPTMVSGAQGSPSTPTWVAVGVSSFVPPTATIIKFVASGFGVTGITIAAAPNNLYAGVASTSNIPPVIISATGQMNAVISEMLLESANIYVGANNGALTAFGWEDNI